MLAWEATLGEAVHALGVGAVLQPGRNDVVCLTFAGRVAAFSRGVQNDADQAAADQSRLITLREEVAALRARAEKARARDEARADAGAAPARPNFQPRAEFAGARVPARVSRRVPAPRRASREGV